MKCSTCCENMEGDGYTVQLHCPNYDGDTYEPDAPAIHCEAEPETLQHCEVTPLSVSQPQTIGELRAYLDKLESTWTEEDGRYLGLFSDQPLCMLTKQGIGHAYVIYDGTLGLITIQKDQPNE